MPEALTTMLTAARNLVPLMLMSGLLLQEANLKRSPMPRCQQVLLVTSFLAHNM